MLRRLVVKFPHCLITVRRLAALYRQKGLNGSYVPGDDLSGHTVAPPPGHPERHRWKDKCQPQGPIGLLMQNTFMLGATIDFQALALVRHKLADLPIMDTPFQLLKPSFGRYAFQALHSYYATRRTLLRQATDVDPDIYHVATKDLEIKDANCIRCVSTLSAVEQSLKCRIEGLADDTCIFCKQCKSSLVHIYWHCTHPALVQARQALTDPKQQFLLNQLHVLPDHILLGIPTSLSLFARTHHGGPINLWILIPLAPMRSCSFLGSIFLSTIPS